MKLSAFRRFAAAGVAATVGVATLAVMMTATPAFATGSIVYPTGTSTTSDGQLVTVTEPAGTFAAGAAIQIVECAGTAAAPPSNNQACVGGTLNAQGTAANDGSFSQSYRVWVLGVAGFTFGGTSIHVDASGTNPGVLYVGVNQNDFTQSHVFTDVTIGDFGNAKLVPQTSATAFPGGPAVTINAASGAATLDSAGHAENASYSVTTAPPAAQGTASCTTAGSCTFTPASTASTASPTTFVVTNSVTPTTGTWVGSNPVTTTSSCTAPVAGGCETVPWGHGNNPTVTPTPNPLNLSSSAPGTTGQFNPNAAGTDSAGNAETITGVTSTNGTYGTVSCAAASPFTCTYTINNPSTAPAGGANDTVTLTATAVVAGTTSPTFTGTGTETITIPAQYTPNCDITSGNPACPLNQIINIPITPGHLTLAQSSGLPTDVLNKTLNGSGQCTGPAITLNGQPQYACGTIAPLTVVNARGTDAGWDLTGQITDFIDSGLATSSTLTPVGATPLGTSNNLCDLQNNYTNHCIPGGNAGWGPAAAVAQGIVPGDVAEVLPGLAITAPGIIAPTTVTTGTLAGTCGTYVVGGPTYAPCATQATITFANPLSEPAPPGGFHNAAQTICSSSEPVKNQPFGGSQAMPAGHAGGTFVCGALLSVAVPASAFAPTVAGINGATGFEAFLTLTLA